MKCSLKIILISVVAAVAAARASNLDTIGITLLRATTTNLNGSGVRVAQPEAAYPFFEVTPAKVGQPTNLFTYFSAAGTATNFPNSLGVDSQHADDVANNFYGWTNGVATNVIHVDDFEANYFYDLVTTNAVNVNDPVINQSFIFGQNDFSHFPVATEQSINSQFDDYAAHFNTLFVSGAGNGGPTNQSQVYPPASCYNGLGVAAFNGNSCTGPTLDNGRCKPDITAPANETSYSTPLVAGAAAILLQAGARGDGGGDTNSATDPRTVKALLLNGAVKPANWTNATFSPLDMRYGAGVANVFNSYEQLAGGQHGYVVSTTVSSGSAHPPNGAAGSVATLKGWDFTNCTSLAHPATDAVNHYYLNVTNGTAGIPFTATITLVWNRQQSQVGINNLDLFLYNCANSNLVMCSTSLVDNVEHIFLPKLAPGRYDLQVWKAGGSGIISTSESYALAWNFSPEILNAINSGTNLNLSWPIYPAGFAVAATTNLTTAIWRTNNLPVPVVANGQNLISIPETNAVQFFRLQTPNF